MGLNLGTQESCHRAAVTLLGLCVIISVCFTTTTGGRSEQLFDIDLHSSGDLLDLSFSDFSFLQSQSSLPYTDRIPCVFRSELKLHKETWRLDTCVECICVNGSEHCDYIHCPVPRCPEPVRIPGECCRQCPLKFQLFDVFSRLHPWRPDVIIKEGHKQKYKFSADVEIFKKGTSKQIRGEHLWQIGAWVSKNEDGTGKKFSYSPNIIKQRQQSKDFKREKEHYNPSEGKYFRFDGMKYTFDATEGLCEDFQYLCIKFNVTGDPAPIHGLSFTYTVYKDEFEREISCVRLGECRGVIAQSFNWELTTEDPIPGEETPVSVDIDVTFKEDIRNLNGDDLWRVSLFGSSNPTGDGPRFGEVAQILNDNETSTDIRNGDPLEIRGIETEFEIGTVGCIKDVTYVCMEVLKGDAPDPDFTFITGRGRGNQTGDSLITCKPQECQSKVVFTRLDATLISPEKTDDTKMKVKLKATTDKDVTTTVAGEQLWQVSTFFSTNTQGRGPRIKKQRQILTSTQGDQTLKLGKNLVFKEIVFEADLGRSICKHKVIYMCFQLSKNPRSSIDYTFLTRPVGEPFVDCIRMENMCEGMHNGP